MSDFNTALKEVQLEIQSLGSQGEGVAFLEDGEKIFVPKTLPQETIKGHIAFRRGGQKVCHLTEVLTPSPQRQNPFCPVFDRCGGCSLQHLQSSAYQDFKYDQAYHLFSKYLDKKDILWSFQGKAAQRRRVSLSYRYEKNSGLKLGFFMQSSHYLISLESCPLLTPALNALIQPLRDFLPQVLSYRDEGFLHLTETAEGVDCSWSPRRIAASVFESKTWALWVDFATQHGIARITRAAKELIVQHRQPKIEISGYWVDFPAAAFLQPSVESQEAMQALAQDAIKSYLADHPAIKQPKILDLFCGLGTFSLPFVKSATVHSIDYTSPSLSSLSKLSEKNLTVEARDLMNKPLKSSELRHYDVIIIDPPRAGAYEQIQQISEDFKGLIVMISCDLSTARRDTQCLIDQGFELKTLHLIDQFPFTSHLEGLLVFTPAQA